MDSHFAEGGKEVGCSSHLASVGKNGKKGNEYSFHALFMLLTACCLKVSKSQKQIFFFSILPKNERKTFALVGRSNFGKYFVRFLGESRISIFAFEIY
jgi:hypothetical protein